jgi:hypothetical protein
MVVPSATSTGKSQQSSKIDWSMLFDNTSMMYFPMSIYHTRHLHVLLSLPFLVSRAGSLQAT